MTQMEDFFTRDAANEGIELPLYKPSGEKSEHWIRIRGVDSDVFRLQEAKAQREAINLAAIDDVQKRAEEVRKIELRTIASLVIAWSFDMEPTEANIVDFLSKAPQIADVINQAATRRMDFVRKKSQNSTNGQKQKSSSRSRQKVPQKASGHTSSK